MSLFVHPLSKTKEYYNGMRKRTEAVDSQEKWRIQRWANQARTPLNILIDYVFLNQVLYQTVSKWGWSSNEKHLNTLILPGPSSGPLDRGRKGLRASCPISLKIWIRPCSAGSRGRNRRAPPLNFDRLCLFVSRFVSQCVKIRLREHERASKTL